MITVFDTETSGVPIKTLPDDHPSQPRLVSLAAVSFSEDGQTELHSFYMIAKPEGFEISKEVTEKHGISHEMAMDVGIDARVILITFFHLYAKSRLAWAFNSQFDNQIIRRESRFHSLEHGVFNVAKQRCVMLAASAAMKMPNKHGYASYAWPKLAEAYEWLYQTPLVGAHNALHDTRATGWLGFGLRDKGLWDFETQT